eukprot:1589241-Pleurochrysis_carterae.AAC.4
MSRNGSSGLVGCAAPDVGLDGVGGQGHVLDARAERGVVDVKLEVAVASIHRDEARRAVGRLEADRVEVRHARDLRLQAEARRGAHGEVVGVAAAVVVGEDEGLRRVAAVDAVLVLAGDDGDSGVESNSRAARLHRREALPRPVVDQLLAAVDRLDLPDLLARVEARPHLHLWDGRVERLVGAHAAVVVAVTLARRVRADYRQVAALGD